MTIEGAPPPQAGANAGIGTGTETVRDRLRRALPAAAKARDRVAMSALRSALGAIDNAEAVNAPAFDSRQPPITGVGAAETARRILTESELDAIVRAEVADRRAAADEYERLGRADQAERLRREADIIASHLDHQPATHPGAAEPTAETAKPTAK